MGDTVSVCLKNGKKKRWEGGREKKEEGRQRRRDRRDMGTCPETREGTRNRDK